MEKLDLRSLTYQELEDLIVQAGEKKFRTQQVFSWLHEKGVSTIDEMTNLSKAFREKLSEIATIHRVDILEKYVSAKDGTVKYLMRLSDGECIETVVMEYKHGTTICVSSQVGCRMGCRFCASTLGGKKRDLLAGEILGQILSAQADLSKRISNIVMMGIGEPLDNLKMCAGFCFWSMTSADSILAIGIFRFLPAVWLRELRSWQGWIFRLRFPFHCMRRTTRFEPE